jgi:acyl carrier protein phosphodiesterase
MVNWLAHLRVAPAAPLLRLGHLCGDFARGADLGALPAAVRLGIDQHRLLDRFTDAHPAFQRSRERLGAPWRRFAGVLVDVFYDHFLARDWRRHGDGQPLRAFVDQGYALLVEHAPILPPRLAAALPHMLRDDWLGGYATLGGIDATLARMASRGARLAPLTRGGELLRQHRGALARDFARFFPELLAFAAALPPRGEGAAFLQGERLLDP